MSFHHLKLKIAFVTLAFLVSGCGQQISDFVKSGPSAPPIDQNGPANGVNRGVFETKVSPSANFAQGNNLKSHFSVTASQVVATGNALTSKYSFHANRPTLSK